MTLPETDESKPIVRPKLRWLDTALALGGLLAYLLYLTEDFLVSWSPLKGLTLFWVVVGLLVGGFAARLYLAQPRPLAQLLGLAQKSLASRWPWLVLLAALVLGGFLRWQTLQKPPALTEPEHAFAQAIVNLVKTSNWQPPNFTQPPLYLYLNTLLTNALVVQSTASPNWVEIDSLQPETYLSAYRNFNLALGLLTLLPVYGAGALLFGRRAGAVAALLLAGAWISYRTTPLLVPQTLAALLAAFAFYLIVRACHSRAPNRWLWFWAGAACGLATSAAYGAILLLIPLYFGFRISDFGLKKHIPLTQSTPLQPEPEASHLPSNSVLETKNSELETNPKLETRNSELETEFPHPSSLIPHPFLGWLLAFTLLVSGWLLSLPRFLNGLAAIGKAPENAPVFYFKELAKHDPGLLLALIIALVLALFNLRLKERNRDGETEPGSVENPHPSSFIPHPSTFQSSIWLVLAFPLLYLIALMLIGPLDGVRLTLIAPFLALCAAYPVELAARFMARILNDEHHRWAGSATAFGMVILILISGVIIRRFWG